jgi:hypothetical protein
MDNTSVVGIFPSNAAVENSILSIYNANEQATYQNKTLPEYQQAVADWVQGNSHSRELAPDPASYVPTPAPAKPQQTVWYLDANLALQTKLVPDPTIPDAVLPPYVGNQSAAIKSPAPPDPVLSALMAIYQQNLKVMAALKISVLLLAVGLSLASSARAQVRIGCTPEPIAVMQSLHVKTMGQWACFLRNDGTAARTLAPEDLYLAILAIKPIDPASAIIVLSDHQAHSTAATIVKVLGIAGQLSGVGLSLASRANAGLGTGLAIGGGFLQPVLTIAQGQVPSTAAFTSNLFASPLTLPPGGAATKTVFAAKQKAPAPISAVLP